MLLLNIIRFQWNNRLQFKNMPNYLGSKVRDRKHFQTKQKYFLCSLVLLSFIKSSYFHFQSWIDTEGCSRTLTTLVWPEFTASVFCTGHLGHRLTCWWETSSDHCLCSRLSSGMTVVLFCINNVEKRCSHVFMREKQDKEKETICIVNRRFRW